MIKGSIQEEDITIINIYAPNIGAPQCVRQMLASMKGEISNNTIIVGDFNTPLTPMDRSTKQKINDNGIILIINCLKCKRVKCSDQKTKTSQMNTKTKPLYLLPTRDPPQNKGHIQTEIEGIEKDISCKWR